MLNNAISGFKSLDLFSTFFSHKDIEKIVITQLFAILSDI